MQIIGCSLRDDLYIRSEGRSQLMLLMSQVCRLSNGIDHCLSTSTNDDDVVDGPAIERAISRLLTSNLRHGCD